MDTILRIAAFAAPVLVIVLILVLSGKSKLKKSLEASEAENLRMRNAFDRFANKCTFIAFVNLSRDTVEFYRSPGAYSERFEEMAAGSASSLAGYIADNLVHPDDRDAVAVNLKPENIALVLKEKEGYIVPITLNIEGSYIPYQFTIASVGDDEAVIGAEPIIEKKESSTEEQLLSDLSFKIRTPVNTILGTAELARKQAENPEELKEMFSRISDASRELLAAITPEEESEKDELQISADSDPAFIVDAFRTEHFDEPANIKGAKILLVEDNDLNRGIVEDLLVAEEASVVTAENGEDAVRIFRESAPYSFDAIIMDIEMPVMNGLEASKVIRRLSRPDVGTLPIIAMTANAQEDYIRKSRQAGMNAHLTKPVDLATLTGTLHNYIKK